MKVKLAIVTVLLIVAAVACFMLFSLNGNSVEQLPEVVSYVEPEAYYSSPKVHRFHSTDDGQGMALLPRQFDTGEFTVKPIFNRHEGFVGPKSCKECHAEQYEGFIHTAHFKTSALATRSSIRGSFDDENVVKTRVDGFRYELTEENGEFFQKLLVDKEGETYEHKCRFDIVTGSGNKGQSYVYSQQDSLYQLPITWLTNVGWVNSPGYPDGFANFARPVIEECMSCHSTMVDFASNKVNIADPKKMILGVTCERCHGPAESHVKYHHENPEATDTKFISHPGDLPRERLNDICAQCHSGKSSPIKSTFNFRPGDEIAQFKRLQTDSGLVGSVHTANQYPRMIQSKCYLESETMHCATCHNPHKHERGDQTLFSSRCMKCHQSSACGKFPELGSKIESNCVDCHMPKRDDTQLKIETSAEVRFPEIRDHFIRIDTDATQKVLDAWKAEK